MIRVIDNNSFILETASTSYIFRLLPTGQLEHLYYGRKLVIPNGSEAAALAALTEKHAFAPGNTNVYDDEHKSYSLEDMRLEMSSYGKGDIREPFICIRHWDGSTSSDFIYDSYEIMDDTLHLADMPSSYDESGCAQTLSIRLIDRSYDQVLYLNYVIYEAADVICRNARLVNGSAESVTLLRLMSMMLDFDRSGYVFTSFRGAWAREMQREDCLLTGGKYIASSYTGTSSNRCNPFFMLHPLETTEDTGIVYGFNLVYSGNHYECAESSSFGKTRVLSGINPEGFAYTLEPGESFDAPEAVMTFSDKGYNGMSHNMHHFIREHIVRGEWKKKTRPVLLNSWEAAYFDINEGKLLRLARAAREVGIELFVMDDGWFGERNDDSSSLGDWDVNKAKLPGGLKSLADKVNSLGLDFGIWVEPEMVSVNSRLYKAHPDWSVEIPGRAHSEGRNQRLLDLSNPDVQTFVINKMSEVFSSAAIAYVKWDMNRIFSDYYSQYLPADRQGELSHRYVLGLYHCMKVLTERFPHILFEGCASGGNRFDLGILCYFPQIWASDDTDALCRLAIQSGYSYGYPMSTVSAHVSDCPNHQTLRTTPLESRFNVAAFGLLGYECNLCDMSREDLAAIKAQIELYKEWREVLQWGDFYRGIGPSAMPRISVAMSGISPGSSAGDNFTEWTCVSPDKTRAVGMVMQTLAVPNSPFHCYHVRGLDPDSIYHFYNRALKVDVREFGDLVNTASPIHIKKDGLLMGVIARFVKMDGETEDITAPGSVLMDGGVHLKQAFGATGFNSEVRHFPDFGSRIYFLTT
ncbi:alpha-galactosidase [Butyrivibrio sp. MC2013]|uniref:alpha-galactosidase n=1 Tax=Butyrivibrio sp. MC2013 TaxID=1280686 RepID=UPI00041B9FE5|nr:alpha-galactosidase [Butyrivibrio sp. MC2013]